MLLESEPTPLATKCSMQWSSARPCTLQSCLPLPATFGFAACCWPPS
jgi:hypothetical protein